MMMCWNTASRTVAGRGSGAINIQTATIQFAIAFSDIPLTILTGSNGEGTSGCSVGNDITISGFTLVLQNFVAAAKLVHGYSLTIGY